jgi:hypothetical protein
MRISPFVPALLALAPVFAAGQSTTFTQDVLPVLQKNCQTCHHPGEIGPMPLLTYEQVRPWAKAIRDAVLQHKMPPWHADARFGHFANDRSLSEADIHKLVAWVESGTPQGSPKDAPKPVTFPVGWRIGKPDLIVEMPVAFDVPATGILNYQYIIVPSGFTEDKWVQAVEVRPGNRTVVHHAVLFSRDPGGEYAAAAPKGEFFELAKFYKPSARPKDEKMFSAVSEPEHLQVYAPGADPIQLGPGQARLIKAGSDIIFEMHYTPNGTAATDRTSVGFVFAKSPVAERVHTIRINNGTILAIPPNEPDHRMQSQVHLTQDVRVVSFQPHMHLRGKSMEFSAVYPSGETEILLRVPKYDFHWQMSYYLDKPKLLPKGTLFICKASWDNSPNNPYNPHPEKRVLGGFQSEDEMMAGFVDLGIAPDLKDLKFFKDAPPEAVPQTVTADTSPKSARGGQN